MDHTNIQDKKIAPPNTTSEPKLSHLAETLIGSEIVKLAGDIR